MKSKDIAIVGILLAIGAILRYFLAMLHTPLTPNMIIAFYCLAIILVKPKILEALGIGIVAGILSMLISSSMFPPGNLISEPLGALACFGLYAMLKDKIAGPAVCTFITTLVSGFSWVAVSLVAVSFGFAAMKTTMMGYMTVFVPIVVITGVFNAIIVQILFFPANRVLNRGS
ncbi:MAG: tryptophan transporter [Methanolinea sp.]|jgi:energy-coupling factor transport system ATP-binding protein